jgi:hypothetical protein
MTRMEAKSGARSVLGGVLVMSLTPLAGLAQEQQFHHGRAGIAIGAFLTDRQTETRLDGNAGVGRGTDIDLETDLGFEGTTNVARFDAYVWIKPRQRFDFAHFDLSRSANKRIQETIDFGDETFDIDAVVHSESGFEVTKIGYTIAPLNRERGYLGLTGGLYVASLNMSLSEQSLGTVESEDLTAPLPVIGIRGEYEVTPKVTIGGATQWFNLDVGDASGRLTDFYIGGDYSFGRHAAVGLAYNKVSMSVKAEEVGGFTGHVAWNYDGWLLYFKAAFGE